MTPVGAGRRNLAAWLVPLAPGLPGAISLPRPRPGGGTSARAGAATAQAGEAPTVADEAPTVADVVTRAAAAGHPNRTVDALAELWPGLDPLARRQIAAPLAPDRDGVVRLGTRPAVQARPTTCGSAVLVMLAAAGDPVLATWLVTGHRVGDLPAPLQGAPGDGDADDPQQRFATLQEEMLRATNRRGLVVTRWPGRFGTPPWTAARHAIFPGVRYTNRPVDDADPDGMARIAAWIRASVGRGVPVPLYTGGDLVHGPASAVPRHVVLVVPGGADDDVLTVYEPTTGHVVGLPVGDLVARTSPHRALGGWIHVCWAILPRAARGADRRHGDRGHTGRDHADRHA